MKRTLQEARAIAEKLEYQAATEGGSGVETCDNCNKTTFEIHGSSDGGIYSYGECLYCGHVISNDEANEKELTYKIENSD